MIVLAVHGVAEDPGRTERLAACLGRTVFEIRQRLAGCSGGPVVLVVSGDRDSALYQAGELSREGFSPLVLDGSEWRADEFFAVEEAVLQEKALILKGGDAEPLLIPWQEIGVLVRGMRISAPRPRPEPARKSRIPFLGRRKRRRRSVGEEPGEAERTGFLYLSGEGRRALLAADRIDFVHANLERLHPAREENFEQLVAELRRCSPRCRYDQRLLTRAGQARILGPQLPPERFWPLAIGLVEASLEATG